MSEVIGSATVDNFVQSALLEGDKHEKEILQLEKNLEERIYKDTSPQARLGRRIMVRIFTC